MVQEILVGPERRRRWSDEQKIAIVVEAASGGTSVTRVARRHGITRQQIYQWRSDIRRGRLVAPNGGPFLAVEFVDATGADDTVPSDLSSVEPPADVTVEIALAEGRVLRFPASLSPATVTALIRAVEAA